MVNWDFQQQTKYNLSSFQLNKLYLESHKTQPIQMPKKFTSKKMQESSSLSAGPATLVLSRSGTMNLATNESR